MNEATPADGWSPPKADDNGVALHGDYPLNLRLRAEALAKDGKDSDPDDRVSPDTIAEAGARLKRAEAAEAERERNTPSLKWTEKRLRDEAERLGLAVETDANKPAILKAIEAAPAASQTEA